MGPVAPPFAGKRREGETCCLEKRPQVLFLRWRHFGNKPWVWGLEAWLPVLVWSWTHSQPFTAPPRQGLRVGSGVQWPVLKCQQGQEGKGPLLPPTLVSHLSDGAGDSRSCLHRTLHAECLDSPPSHARTRGPFLVITAKLMCRVGSEPCPASVISKIHRRNRDPKRLRN